MGSHPSPDRIADALLASFICALKAFEHTWASGWVTPGHERACVGYVARKLEEVFAKEVTAWCEVPLNHIYRKFGKPASKDVWPKGPVDLVLCDRDGSKVLALVEFKTHSGWFEDRKKLESLWAYLAGDGNPVRIDALYLVACHGFSYLNGSREKHTNELERIINERIDGLQSDWKHKTSSAPTEVPQKDGGQLLIRPIVAWRAELDQHVPSA